MLEHENLPTCNSLVTKDATNLLSNFDDNVNCANSSCFEGPEKLLEVWFAPAPDALPHGVKENGLKSVNLQAWEEMLNLVNCKILSVIESKNVDAYLLSESSMFVFPHKLILKTCGTTTLLFGLSRILNIAVIEVGFPQSERNATGESCAIPYRVFYSRKKFLFPDKQQGPHRCWENEVEYLDNIFEGGSAYMVGKVNGDHWYLYLTLPNTSILTSSTTEDSSRNKSLKVNYNSFCPGSQEKENHDETLEILMTDLDQENAKKFYVDHANKVLASNISADAKPKWHNMLDNMEGFHGSMKSSKQLNRIKIRMPKDEEKHSYILSAQSGFLTPPKETSDEAEITQGRALGAIVTEMCGLLDVFPSSEYPNACVDSHLFSPCGLSVNGLIPSINDATAYYFTVHVTPEPHCSYASFESNVPTRLQGRDTVDVVKQVVEIFKPGHFSVTLFEEKKDSIGELKKCNINQGDVTDNSYNKNKYSNLDKITGYNRKDRIIHQFEGYNLVFCSYEKKAELV
ncbi:S-adenosylmethionine decarboxylase proenzyme [Erysiphe necator]|nr:S-adenosylmethionine decarboxylase proenzyme [Erysiphe necator]